MKYTITIDAPEETIVGLLKQAQAGSVEPWKPIADLKNCDKDEIDGEVFEVATRGGNIFLSTYSARFGGFSSDVVAFRRVPDFPKDFLDSCSSQTKQATSHSLPKE